MHGSGATMMDHMVGMMAGMGLVWILVVLVLALAAVFLAKRIFFGRSGRRDGD